MKKIVFAIAALVVILASCSLDVTGNGFNIDPSVYVGGSYLDDGVEKACYWVDGIQYNLDGTSVERITTSGGKVYTAGYYREGESLKACYWINKTRYDLPGCTKIGRGGITVDRGNVFIVGLYNKKRYYWVNGVRYDPPAGGIINEAYAANGSLYISGYYMKGTTPKPCYWVDGKRYDLPNIVSNNADMDYASVVIVENKNTYITGMFWGNNSERYTTYWINGVQQKVFNNEPPAGFSVENGNVYIATAKGLYINGDLVSTMDKYDVLANDFTVSRGKVYYACHALIWNGYPYRGCYLIDGVRHDLPSGASANCIFVEE